MGFAHSGTVPDMRPRAARALLFVDLAVHPDPLETPNAEI